MNTRTMYLSLMVSRIVCTAASFLLGMFVAYSSDQVPAKPQDHPIAIVGNASMAR